MNKYNEIMSNVTVDPEMKARIMTAVSAAIKEPPEEAAVTDIFDEEDEQPVRRKAKRTPLIIISSIAAGILVIAGVLFIMRGMGKKSASDLSFNTEREENKAYDTAEAPVESEISLDINYFAGSAETTTAAQTRTDSLTSEEGQGGEFNYARPDSHVTLTDPDSDENITYTYKSTDASEGMGDVRLDNISGELPFDIKGSGTGTFSDSISQEVFIGVGGQKVLLLKAPEGIDLVKAFDPTNDGTYTEGVTHAGTAVKLYRVVFGNVKALGKGETSSEVNAALFMRNGNVYLLVFSDPQVSDVIYGVADVV